MSHLNQSRHSSAIRKDTKHKLVFARLSSAFDLVYGLFLSCHFVQSQWYKKKKKKNSIITQSITGKPPDRLKLTRQPSSHLKMLNNTKQVTECISTDIEQRSWLCSCHFSGDLERASFASAFLSLRADPVLDLCL